MDTSGRNQKALSTQSNSQFTLAHNIIQLGGAANMSHKVVESYLMDAYLSRFSFGKRRVAQVKHRH